MTERGLEEGNSERAHEAGRRNRREKKGEFSCGTSPGD